MSNREHFPIIKSTVAAGEWITFHRDNDTRTYRLFVLNGARKAEPYGSYRSDAGLNCDLSVDDVRALIGVLKSAVDAHKPWPDYED